MKVKHFLQSIGILKTHELPTLKYSIERQEFGSIGLFNDATIISIERELPHIFDYDYHSTREGKRILGYSIRVKTTKGSFYISSCNNCMILYFDHERDEK